MVIGVDAGALSITDDRLKVGVWRVTANALGALAHLDRENTYRFYTFGEVEQGIVRAFEGRAQLVRLPQLGWHRVWLPIELKKRPVDAFLGFAQALPFISTLCDIGFVYDVGFLYRPDAYGAAAPMLKKQTDNLIRRADHIIAISRVTETDIARQYGTPSGQVTVAYPGVGPIFSPDGGKYENRRPYILFVGSLNKAKDIPALIDYVSGTHYDVFLIGGEYWPDPAIDETIRRLRYTGRVKKLGFVPDEELPQFYRGASAFVTTALNEGFCLPAVEAMACGTPVVALDRGALREIVGEGGIIISTQYTVRSAKLEFVKALEKMKDKKTREAFSKRAIAQSKKFRWEKFAKHVLVALAHEH